jgi:uncharacterized protein YndB with AHSA1/START domain
MFMTDIELMTSVSIDAPATSVWEALTTPELIKQWFFGVDTETDWEVGSSLVHRGEWQGQPYEDKGTILTFDPPKTLMHSHWSPMSGVPDEPPNYELVTWNLSELDGWTELTIHEANLASEQAKDASEQGWKAALNNLKELLERAPSSKDRD